jgi:integrase
MSVVRFVFHWCLTVSGVHIRSRVLPDGSRRHDVRYRRGGRGYRVEHAGTFTSLKEAGIRRALVGGWLAAGLDPRREFERLLATPSVERFSVMAERWLVSRRDLDESTRGTYRGNLVRINKRFGDEDAHLIAPSDVISWIGEMVEDGLKPGTVAGYVRQVRMILDGVAAENPARHSSVRLPKGTRSIPEPPDADDVVALLVLLNVRYRMAVLLLEQTGMRVSEAIAMSDRDIDAEGLRIRVRPESSKTSRGRWIPVEPWLVPFLQPLRGVERTALGNAMRRAAGLHPHLLRHRRATLWHQQGVVASELARRLGHARPSISLDVYQGVRPLQEAPPEVLLHHLTRP